MARFLSVYRSSTSVESMTIEWTGPQVGIFGVKHFGGVRLTNLVRRKNVLYSYMRMSPARPICLYREPKRPQPHSDHEEATAFLGDAIVSSIENLVSELIAQLLE